MDGGKLARVAFDFIAEPAELVTHVKKPWYEIENRIQLISDKFNDSVLDGWKASGGTWSAAGGSVHSANNGSIFIYIGATSNERYIYESEVSLIHGSEAGILFRRLDNNNYFQFILKSGGSAFLQNANGATTYSSADQAVNYNTWYKLKADCSGNTIKCYVNDIEKINCLAGSIFPSGNIGLKMYAGSAAFDNVDCYQLTELLTPATHGLEGFRVNEASNDKVSKLSMNLGNKDNYRLPLYELNHEIKCKLGYSGETLGSIFGGTIVEVSPDLDTGGNNFSVEAMGYSYDLIKKVDVITYENKSGGEIIKDLLNRNFPNIDTGSIIYSGIGLPNYKVVYTPVFDAVKDIANNYDDGVFLIDYNKMAHYISGESIATNATNAIAGSNILRASFSINNDNLFNSIYIVGGDKPLLDQSRTGTIDGSFMITDAVQASGTFKPAYYNMLQMDLYTNPVTSGIGLRLEIQKQSGTSPDGENIGYGAIESDHINTNNWTPIELDNKILVTSGNTYWWIATADGTGSIWLYCSGGWVGSIMSFREYYGKSIISHAIDWSSVKIYTNNIPKEKVIVDRRIKHQTTADTKAKTYLKQHSQPKYEGKIDLIGDATIRAGRYMTIVIPQHSINENFVVTDVTHSFSNSGFKTNITCDAEIRDLAFKMEDHEERIKALENVNIDTEINLVKFFDFFDTFNFSGDALIRYNITNLGSSFILNHPTLGKLGSDLTPQPVLGDSRSSWEAI